MPRLLKRLLVFLCAALVLLMGATWLYLQTKKPQRSGALTLEGLSQPVNVHYDTWGVPHIYAQSEEDAVHALGYVQAQDRLFQMDLIRRIGSGRLAEIYGNSAVDTDTFFRTLGIRKFASRYIERSPNPSPRSFLHLAQHYVDGVNAFIQTGPTPVEYSLLGLEPAPMTLEDPLHLLGYMAFTFAPAFQTDPVVNHVHATYGEAFLKDLTTTLPATSPTSLKTSGLGAVSRLLSSLDSLLPTGLFHGSNAWVIPGRDTQSGKPILANDPHIGFSLPDVWYEAHISTPTYENYGHHLAGSPIPIIGFNQERAWGMTMLEIDEVDFFKERLNPKNQNEVWYKGAWHPLTLREETLHIKGAPSQTITIKETPHGPIINDILNDFTHDNAEPISMMWTFQDDKNTTPEALYRITHAQSLEDFEQGVALLWAPGLNILYADADDNIAQWGAGRIPVRAVHVNPMLILDGASGEDDPLGYYPFSANPKTINPATGLLVSANNVYTNQKAPYIHGYYSPDERIHRLQKLLTRHAEPWSVERLKAVQTDIQRELPLRARVPVLKALSAPFHSWSLQAVSDRARGLLEGWSGEYETHLAAPTLWERFYFFALKEIYADELTENFFGSFLRSPLIDASFLQIMNNPYSPWWNNQVTKRVETSTVIIQRAWKKAINSLVEQFGDDPARWTWDRVHTLEFHHPFSQSPLIRSLFNVGPFPVPGTRETVNHFGFSLATEECSVTNGPSFRHLISMGDPQGALGVSPLGQSGNVLDPHYQDQTSLYLANGYRRKLLARADVEADTQSILRLLPALPNE